MDEFLHACFYRVHHAIMQPRHGTTPFRLMGAPMPSGIGPLYFYAIRRVSAILLRAHSANDEREPVVPLSRYECDAMTPPFRRATHTRFPRRLPRMATCAIIAFMPFYAYA